MGRDTESKQKLLHRVVLQNFLKRLVGSLSDLEQPLPDRCGEIRNLPFRQSTASMCGRITCFTWQIAAKISSASGLNPRDSR